MLCANVAAARFYEETGLPVLYRVHEGPNPEKLENLRGFLGELGLDLRGGEKPSPEHYCRLLDEVEGRDDANVIQVMLLRSLSQAVYQPENEGHFGLHFQAYAHFTSPIRRYADLLVHRGIRHVIRSKQRCSLVKRIRGAVPLPKSEIFPYDMQQMVAYGVHCSMSERRADDATRDVESWLKCEYLTDHVGDEFDGLIAAVTSFGLFVELVDLYIEGLVHISALPADYYNFDPARQRMVGERSGRSYALGGKVRVQVARVDLDDKKIDLELLDAEPPRKRAAKAKSAKGGQGGKGGKGEKSDKSGAAAAKPKSSGGRRRKASGGGGQPSGDKTAGKPAPDKPAPDKPAGEKAAAPRAPRKRRSGQRRKQD